jgi:hypothetical protein
MDSVGAARERRTVRRALPAHRSAQRPACVAPKSK